MRHCYFDGPEKFQLLPHFLTALWSAELVEDGRHVVFSHPLPGDMDETSIVRIKANLVVATEAEELHERVFVNIDRPYEPLTGFESLEVRVRNRWPVDDRLFGILERSGALILERWPDNTPPTNPG